MRGTKRVNLPPLRVRPFMHKAVTAMILRLVFSRLKARDSGAPHLANRQKGRRPTARVNINKFAVALLRCTNNTTRDSFTVVIFFDNDDL